MKKILVNVLALDLKKKTITPLYINQDTVVDPSYNVCKITPEMWIPRYQDTLAVPRVSAIEMFHC